MKKALLTFLIVITNIAYGQECPNRIGDFIINETSIYDLSIICSCNETANIIKSGQELVNEEVEYEMIDIDYPITSSTYELKPDLEKVNSWYNIDYASLSDSTRVFFIPYYQTNGVSIKNLLLKFKNGNLFYLKASISKSYFEIITEKYKGKGIKTVDKKTPNKCKNAKFKKYLDSNIEITFVSETDFVNAKIYIDNIINSDCEAIYTKTIEIYNPEIYVQYLKTRNILLKKLLDEKIEKDKKEKEERLKKF